MIKKQNKKAAMEMSVGTIVTIVLLMSVLVLGIFLVKQIFDSSKSAIDLTDQQLQNEIGKLFESDAKVVLYPTSGRLKVKSGNSEVLGVGIRNIATSLEEETRFSYYVAARDNTCGLSEAQALSLISLGREETDIPIPINGFETSRVTFSVPEVGIPNCILDYRVNVKKGNADYNSEIFQVEIKS